MREDFSLLKLALILDASLFFTSNKNGIIQVVKLQMEANKMNDVDSLPRNGAENCGVYRLLCVGCDRLITTSEHIRQINKQVQCLQ